MRQSISEIAVSRAAKFSQTSTGLKSRKERRSVKMPRHLGQQALERRLGGVEARRRLAADRHVAHVHAGRHVEHRHDIVNVAGHLNARHEDREQRQREGREQKPEPGIAPLHVHQGAPLGTPGRSVQSFFGASGGTSSPSCSAPGKSRTTRMATS